MAYLAWGMAWVATGCCVCYAIDKTGSLLPLLTFIFPGSISLKHSEKGGSPDAKE